MHGFFFSARRWGKSSSCPILPSSCFFSLVSSGADIETRSPPFFSVLPCGRGTPAPLPVTSAFRICFHPRFFAFFHGRSGVPPPNPLTRSSEVLLFLGCFFFLNQPHLLSTALAVSEIRSLPYLNTERPGPHSFLWLFRRPPFCLKGLCPGLPLSVLHFL